MLETQHDSVSHCGTQRTLSSTDTPPIYLLLIPCRGIQYMGMIEQRLVAIVASYKIKLGIPFSPTWTLPVAPSAAMAAGSFDFPTVTDLDHEVAEGETDPELHSPNNTGLPLSIGDIRQQVATRAERMRRGEGPVLLSPEGSVSTRGRPSVSTRMPPQT